MNENRTNINWYPGHMAKTKREISSRMGMVDIVIEVIDSRVPFSSRIPDLKKLTILHSNDMHGDFWQRKSMTIWWAAYPCSAVI